MKTVFQIMDNSHHSHPHVDPIQEHDHEQHPDFFHIIPYELSFQSPEDQKKLNVETLELKGAYSISFWFQMQNNPDTISKKLSNKINFLCCFSFRGRFDIFPNWFEHNGKIINMRLDERSNTFSEFHVKILSVIKQMFCKIYKKDKKRDGEHFHAKKNQAQSK